MSKTENSTVVNDRKATPEKDVEDAEKSPKTLMVMPETGKRGPGWVPDWWHTREAKLE
jgi:hypothetical protein